MNKNYIVRGVEFPKVQNKLTKDFMSDFTKKLGLKDFEWYVQTTAEYTKVLKSGKKSTDLVKVREAFTEKYCPNLYGKVAYIDQLEAELEEMRKAA